MNKTLRTIILVVASSGLPAAVRSQETQTPAAPYGPWHMMHDGWGMGWGAMFLGPLFMIAWLALLVAVIVLVLRWMGVGRIGERGAFRTPREILDARYARGEIDDDEYEKRRKTLGS